MQHAPKSYETRLFIDGEFVASKSGATFPTVDPATEKVLDNHPGGNRGENLKSIAHRCLPILVAFVWELTEEIIDLPLGCLQGGSTLLTQPPPATSRNLTPPLPPLPPRPWWA